MFMFLKTNLSLKVMFSNFIFKDYLKFSCDLLKNHQFFRYNLYLKADFNHLKLVIF